MLIHPFFFGMNKIVKFLVLLLGFSAGHFVNGQNIAESQIPLLLLNLDMDRAETAIDELSPDDQLSYLALQGFLETMLAQNSETHEQFFKDSRRWLKDIEGIEGENSFVRAEKLFNLSIFRAIVASQFSNYSQAARELIRSYRNYKKLVNEHPAHPTSQHATGLMKVIFEQIPDSYLRLTKAIGIDFPDGDGFEMLARSFRMTTGQSRSTRVSRGLLWVFVLWEFHPESDACWEAWQEVKKIDSQLALVRYTGVVSALKSGKNEEALEILSLMQADRQFESNPHLYYLLGKAYLYAGNAEAIHALKTFLELSTADNYIKSAWLRIAWFYTMDDEVSKASESFDQVVNSGNDDVWADKQALREVAEHHALRKEILKLRLLYDGGYYQECVLASEALIRQRDTFSDTEYVEILYRKGRSYHEQGKYEQSLLVYDEILENYSHVKNYQIPKIAILSAYILYDLKRKEQCLSRIDFCLRMNNYGYQSTFKRQAQALRRKLK